MTIETIDEENGNSTENSTFTLDNGLVQKVASDDIIKEGAQFSYDSSCRLAKCNNFLGEETYTWKDAQLKSMSSVGDGYSDFYSFEYGEISNTSGYCPLLPHRLTNIVLYWARPEFIGIMTNECPNKETDKSSGSSYTISHTYTYTYTYEYEYDDDGFISKITETSKEDGQVYTGVYTMTWE